MSEEQTPYRVLARKYRPQNFDDLIGQDALVRTLKNAIESGRIAHAFMLTGIRGVGKTTTARIIAKALNYTGADGTAGPTTGTTEDCETCKAIAEDRHPDVMEMDAASRTGVDDIREILDGVRYAPTSARYKVYIIDEVHMLSKAAFNALLKTLEEPPPHVKFIFATTEIRKVPVTVLSRCQRFDLRRIDVGTLADYYKNICGKEQVSAEDEALALIARAADGSVRDGLSMLDQAIALSDGNVSAVQVKDMLGLADRGLVIDLFENIVRGDCAPALDLMEDLYKKGADPSVILNDLLDLTHILTKLKTVPDSQKNNQDMPKEELARAVALAQSLSMPALGRCWQMLLKGIGEVHVAPSAPKAAEMVLIRMAYAADLPEPAALIKTLQEEGAGAVAALRMPAPAKKVQDIQPVVEETPDIAKTMPESFQTIADIVAALECAGEYALGSHVYLFAHLVSLDPEGEGYTLSFRAAEDAPKDLHGQVARVLNKATNKPWHVKPSQKDGAPTLGEQARAAEKEKFNQALSAPLVQEILTIFPDAELSALHNKNHS